MDKDQLKEKLNILFAKLKQEPDMNARGAVLEEMEKEIDKCPEAYEDLYFLRFMMVAAWQVLEAPVMVVAPKDFWDKDELRYTGEEELTPVMKDIMGKTAKAAMVDLMIFTPSDENQKDVEKYVTLLQGKKRPVDPEMLKKYNFRFWQTDTLWDPLEPRPDYSSMDNYREIEHKRRHGTLFPPMVLITPGWKGEWPTMDIDFSELAEVYGKEYGGPMPNLIKNFSTEKGLRRGEMMVVSAHQPIERKTYHLDQILLRELVKGEKVLFVSLEDPRYTEGSEPMRNMTPEFLNPFDVPVNRGRHLMFKSHLEKVMGSVPPLPEAGDLLVFKRNPLHPEIFDIVDGPVPDEKKPSLSQFLKAKVYMKDKDFYLTSTDKEYDVITYRNSEDWTVVVTGAFAISKDRMSSCRLLAPDGTQLGESVATTGYFSKHYGVKFKGQK